jgi:hypothetical protein
MSEIEDWPDWKLILAKMAMLWCLGWGVIGLVLVVVALFMAATS